MKSPAPEETRWNALLCADAVSKCGLHFFPSPPPQKKQRKASFKRSCVFAPAGGLRGATVVDALDTLYVMELQEEFQEARNWVEENFDLNVVSPSLNEPLCAAGASWCVCSRVRGEALPSRPPQGPHRRGELPLRFLLPPPPAWIAA